MSWLQLLQVLGVLLSEFRHASGFPILSLESSCCRRMLAKTQDNERAGAQPPASVGAFQLSSTMTNNRVQGNGWKAAIKRRVTQWLSDQPAQPRRVASNQNPECLHATLNIPVLARLNVSIRLSGFLPSHRNCPSRVAAAAGTLSFLTPGPAFPRLKNNRSKCSLCNRFCPSNAFHLKALQKWVF